jgi:membrane-bound ClpP family serine protease
MTENFKNLLLFIFGSSAAVADLLKLGTGIVGLIGATLMLFAGWELWQTRKVERAIKQLELEALRQPAPKEEL